jgi:hypothetical protein
MNRSPNASARLASDFEGEVLGAAAAMKRLFAAERLTFHNIAATDGAGGRRRHGRQHDLV